MRTIAQIEAAAARSWARGQLDEAERERMAELKQKPPPNDARLLAPTQCKVLRCFCVAGKQVQVGDTITLQRHDAESLAALKKVALL